MTLSREEERDEGQEKNQRKKNGHERLGEKEEKREGEAALRAYTRVYTHACAWVMCACAHGCMCAPAYVSASVCARRAPPACVRFYFIIILDIFYISYNNIKRHVSFYVLSISLYSCLYRTRAGTHMRGRHYIVVKSFLALR